MTLISLEEVRPVTLHWVKAHPGHELYEEADRAAKLGTFSGWTYTVPLAECTIKAKIRGDLRKQWVDRWRREISCRQTRLLLPELNAQMVEFLFKLSRHFFSQLVQFISGHNYLLYLQVLMGKSEVVDCWLCGVEAETAWHIPVSYTHLTLPTNREV